MNLTRIYSSETGHFPNLLVLQAAKLAFPTTIAEQLLPCSSIADVFAAVQNGTAAHGVIPFENSTYGPVVATLDLFANSLKHKQTSPPENHVAAHLRSYGDLSASKDVFVPVQHCLLGNLPPDASHGAEHARGFTNGGAEDAELRSAAEGDKAALPSLSHITLVQSHEQALGQCKNFLAGQLPNATRKEVSSTSRAAEVAKEDSSGATVAISSELAAELYGLTILRRSIQDRKDNVTRFLVIGRGNPEAEINYRGSTTVNYHEGDQARRSHSSELCKALIIFTVPHASPGALTDTLETFKRANVNLTSINTRPSGLSAWHYFFFVEVEGEREGIAQALLTLGSKAESQKCLGIWPKAR